MDFRRLDVRWYEWVVAAGLLIVPSVPVALIWVVAAGLLIVPLVPVALDLRARCDAQCIRQSLEKELKKHGFISIQSMEEIVTEDRIRLQLANLDRRASKAMALAMRRHALKLFTILILLNEHAFFQALFEHGVEDSIFGEKGTGEAKFIGLESEGLVLSSELELTSFPSVGPADLQKNLCKSQWKIPPFYVEDRTLRFPAGYIPPFTETSGNIGSGGHGEVRMVKVSGGHLQGYSSEVAGIAEKTIDISDIGEDARRTFLREPDTLRARKYSSILPLLASFITTNVSGFDHLHLLSPYAIGGDMKKWLTSKETPLHPPFLRNQPASLPGFLYKSIVSLVSGLAFVHSEIDGKWTIHGDLKPSNILLFEEHGEWLWKLADFGLSHLKSISDSSGTDRLLGSHEYRAPEYAISNKKYYTSWDVFAMGCIIVELATLIVFGDWGHNRVVEFRNQRQNNGEPERAKDGLGDTSFRTNMPLVSKWIAKLKEQNGSEDLQRLLDVALAMMEREQRDRLLAFDATLDIWELMHREEKAPDFRSACERIVKGHPPNREKYGECYDPVLRSKRRPTVLSKERAKIRQDCLIEIGWVGSVSTSKRAMNLPPVKIGTSFSNLPNAFKNNELFGREYEIRALKSSFEQDNALQVGLYGIGGMGKSHIAWEYVSRLRDESDRTGRILHTFWVQAQDKSVFESSYLDIARKIGIGKAQGQKGVTEVREWLEDLKNGPWVLVLDGMEQLLPEWVSLCPWKAGMILITTKDRGIALMYGEGEANVVEVGRLSEADGGKLLESTSGKTSSRAGALASKLCLPILIKTMGRVIGRDRLAGSSIESMDSKIHGPIELSDFATGQQLRQPWEILNPGTRTVYDILFEPLGKGQPHQSSRSALRLMCFFSCNSIDARFFTKEFKPGDHTHIYSSLTNLCYLTSISKDQYIIHEVIQTIFLRWLSDKMGRQDVWSGYLRALSILIQHYQESRIDQADTSNGMQTPTYLLKLRYKIHIEEFLKHLKLHPLGKKPFSRSAARSVVTFARMLKDDNRFEDSALLLRRVLDGGVEGDGNRERLITQVALIETYRASASGRNNTDTLGIALNQVNKAIHEAESCSDGPYNRRLRAARVHILCDQQDYDAALSALVSLDELKTADPKDPEEDHKALLKYLSLKALIDGSRGEFENNVELLIDSRRAWEQLRVKVGESSYSEQEKREKIEDARLEDANTCLSILKVLSQTEFADESLGEKSKEDANQIYDDIKSEKEERYRRESHIYAEHRHIYDVEVYRGAVNLRYGKWKQDEDYVTDSILTFEKILKFYKEVEKLDIRDKNVRNCAYLLREALDFLVKRAPAGSEYAQKMVKLDKDYDLKPSGSGKD